jgi:4-hydroxythreonine-4-phosphate dehydrogenase
VEFCLGEKAALVTAPSNKRRWQLASSVRGEIAEPHGHTEFLQHLTHSPAVGMMMAGPRLRTVPVTIHEPLAQVSGLLSIEKIVIQTELTIHFLQDYFKIKKPRIAVTGLNPHAGEEGDLGSEEISIIRPAIHHLCQKGLDVSGPFPADGLFAQGEGDFDAVICMYHDQALIPVKTLDFQNTVNITMGLPFVRTSPCHGTAEDIAWQGRANAQHLRAAVEMAFTLRSSL